MESKGYWIGGNAMEHVPRGKESAAYWLDESAEKEVQQPQSSIKLKVHLPSHAAFLELTSLLGQDLLCCIEEVHEKERIISATVFINWSPVYLQVHVRPADSSSMLEFKDLGRHSVVHFHRVCHTIYDLFRQRFLRGQHRDDSQDDESNFSSTESAMRSDDVSVLLEEAVGLRPCPGTVQEEAAQCLARLTDGASRDFQITLASAAVKQEEQVLRTLKASQAAIRWPLAVALMLCCSNPEAYSILMTSHLSRLGQVTGDLTGNDIRRALIAIA